MRKEGLQCANNIDWLIEISELFSKVYPENKERSLAKISFIVLGK